MKRDLAAFKGQRFDVLIVGGGINGAGAARDAAMRGLKVALIEKNDFAAGTSSRSSKLVHGGIRYLEQRDFGLVRQASRERRILQRIAPHLVRPLPFLIPVYRGDRYGLNMIRLGTWLYDALALFRNTHNHRILDAAQALQLEPAMRAEGLEGAALYYDAQMDDARLCLANVTSASESGAAVANHLAVTAFIEEAGRVRGARVGDELSGESFEIRAERVINTAGPWLDEVSALDRAGPRKLRLTKGTHIFVPPLTRQYAITIPSSDERVIFVIPWDGMSLVGTTDTDFQGDPAETRPTAEEIDYLLSEVRRIIPGHQLSADSVISAYAGVRALAREEGVAEREVSREHKIHESPRGLISLAGGKYTTYRDVARQLIDRVSSARCSTHLRSLPGGSMGDFERYEVEEAPRLAAAHGIGHDAARQLLRAYGTRTEAVLELGPDVLEARVRYAVEEEMALSLTDVLRRRTQVAFGPGGGLPLAEPVSRIMAELLGWDEDRRRRELQAYAAEQGHGAPQLTW